MTSQNVLDIVRNGGRIVAYRQANTQVIDKDGRKRQLRKSIVEELRNSNLIVADATRVEANPVAAEYVVYVAQEAK